MPGPADLPKGLVVESEDVKTAPAPAAYPGLQRDAVREYGSDPNDLSANLLSFSAAVSEFDSDDHAHAGLAGSVQGLKGTFASQDVALADTAAPNLGDEAIAAKGELGGGAAEAALLVRKGPLVYVFLGVSVGDPLADVGAVAAKVVQ